MEKQMLIDKLNEIYESYTKSKTDQGRIIKVDGEIGRYEVQIVIKNLEPQTTGE